MDDEFWNRGQGSKRIDMLPTKLYVNLHRGLTEGSRLGAHAHLPPFFFIGAQVNFRIVKKV